MVAVPQLEGVSEGLVSVGNSALMIAVIVFVVLVAIGVICGFIYFYYYRYKRYREYACKVFYKDGFGNTRFYYDDAGVFVKLFGKHKRLWLKMGNVGLDPDKFKYIQGDKGRREIWLLKTGNKNYHFINVNIADPKLTLQVTEEDLNWALAEYDGLKRWSFQKLLDWLPYIMVGVSVIAITVIMVYVVKNFHYFTEGAVAFDSAAKTLLEAAQTYERLYNQTLSTTVVN